ncbi:hypothetical protein ABH922_004145 [Rhodococcus sp. 27YEA15]
MDGPDLRPKVRLLNEVSEILEERGIAASTRIEGWDLKILDCAPDAEVS